jgi:excisionase family DNA binding protein
MEKEIEKLLRDVEVAEILGVSRSWVRDAVARLEIPHIKLRSGQGAVRFRRSEIEAWIREKSVPARRLYIDRTDLGQRRGAVS